MDGSATSPDPGQVTSLLERVDAGDREAAERLLPLVYAQLREAANEIFARERGGHTLQPTALVHEAYVKLVRGERQGWNGREHFCAVAARAMRQILCDHARAKRAAKRSAGGDRVSITVASSVPDESALDVLVLDEYLELLARVDEQGASVVDLRFFGGLTHPEIAVVLGVSVPTVDRAWRRSRAWMKANLERTER